MSTYSLTKSKVSETYYRVLQIADDDVVLDGLGITVSISEDNLQGIYTSYSVLRSDVDILMGGGTQSSGGFTGPQGYQGFLGITGFQGNQGPQGLMGSTGMQGFQGVIGIGESGPTGLQGVTGPTGLQGPQGWQGFQGEIGASGLTGNSGGWSVNYILEGGNSYVSGHLEMEGGEVISATTKMRGSSLDVNGNNIFDLLTLWDENFRNSPTIILKIYDISDSLFYHFLSTRGVDLRAAGEGLEISNVTYIDGCADDEFGLRTIGLSLLVQGDPGSIGFQGFTGFQGRQGPQPDPVPGAQGFQGIQGPQGAQGRQGFQGAQGRQGIQGNQGNQGVVGVTGIQGIQGPVSSSNTNTLIMTQSYTSSSSSDTVVTGLTFSTEPGSRYMVNVIGLFRSNNASGNPSFGLDAGSGATISGWLRRGTTTAPTANQGYLLNGAPLAGAATMTANTDFPFFMEASVVTPNFGGTLSVIVSSTSPHILTVQPNSLMNVVKVG